MTGVPPVLCMARCRARTGQARRLSYFFGVVEGNDIGRAFVLQEALVETGHFGGGDEVNAQIKASIGLRFPEQRLHDTPQQAQVDAASAVAVAKRQSAAHASALAGWGRVWPR